MSRRGKAKRTDLSRLFTFELKADEPGAIFPDQTIEVANVLMWPVWLAPLYKNPNMHFRPLIEIFVGEDGWVVGRRIGDDTSMNDKPGKMFLIGKYFGEGVEDFYYVVNDNCDFDTFLRDNRTRIMKESDYWWKVLTARKARFNAEVEKLRIERDERNRRKKAKDDYKYPR